MWDARHLRLWRVYIKEFHPECCRGQQCVAGLFPAKKSLWSLCETLKVKSNLQLKTLDIWDPWNMGHLPRKSIGPEGNSSKREHTHVADNRDEEVAQATSVECKGWFCLHLGQRYPVDPLCKCLHKFTNMDASFIPQACFNPISLAFDISYQCPFLLNLTHKHISLNLSPYFKKYTSLLLEWKAWQHAGVIFHLLPHRIWGANLGHQAWQQIPLSIVPSWLSEKTQLFKSCTGILDWRRGERRWPKEHQCCSLSLFPNLSKCDPAPATTSGSCSCHHALLIIMDS